MTKGKQPIRHCPTYFGAGFKTSRCGLWLYYLEYATSRKRVTCKNCLRIMAAQERKETAKRAKIARLAAKHTKHAAKRTKR